MIDVFYSDPSNEFHDPILPVDLNLQPHASFSSLIRFFYERQDVEDTPVLLYLFRKMKELGSGSGNNVFSQMFSELGREERIMIKMLTRHRQRPHTTSMAVTDDESEGYSDQESVRVK
jgi:hypothetical protein